MAWGVEMGQAEAGQTSHLRTGAQDMLGAGKGVHYWGPPNSVSAYYHGDPEGVVLEMSFTHRKPHRDQTVLHQKKGKGHVSLIITAFAASLPWHSSPHCC